MTEPVRRTLAVRTVAEFVHRRGDIHARLDGRTRAEEGIATQRRLQRDRGEGYQRERAVALDVVLGGEPVRLGRSASDEARVGAEPKGPGPAL